MTREQKNYIANNRETTTEPTTTGQPKFLAAAAAIAIVAAFGLHDTTSDNHTLDARKGFSSSSPKYPGQKPFPRPRG